MSVKADLEAAAGGPIDVELTTFGGDYFQAAPIYNLLVDYPGKKTLYINGIVASAGTFFAMAFDKIVVRSTSMFMIHNAQGISFGDHNAFRKDADRQEKMSDMVAGLYAKRTGKTVDKVKEWMDGEGDGTWFMGQEILDAGFADEMEETKDKPTSMMLLTAQKGFQDRVTMWAKMPQEKPDTVRQEVESMISAGKFDRETGWTSGESDKVVGFKAEANGKFKYPVAKNGVVFRSSLRSISARAAQDDPELAQWAVAMIAKIDAKGAKAMNEDDVVAYLKDKPAVFQRVAMASGHGGLLVGDSHKSAADLKAKLDAAGLADPIGMFATMKADLEKVEADKFKVAMSENFGPEKYENGQENLLRQYAETKLKGVKSAELAAKVEEFKKDPLALKLAGERMDANADVNVFGKSEKGGAPGSAGNGGFERHLKL